VQRLLLLLVLIAAVVHAEESKTVVGPTNANLAAGADALLARDAEEGIRLTHLGLNAAANRRERVSGLSNLCAGYAMLEQWQTALQYCDQALELNERHWRSYSNRALVYIKLKRYADAQRAGTGAELEEPENRSFDVA
jgi:tetratricopeptide (TPR) repeat protein